jgi:outer membrane protein assembly factor BamD
MKYFILIITLSNLYGCSTLDLQDETSGWSAQQIYSNAKEALDDGNYETAIKYYEVLESRYPLGKLAQQAQLDVIYAYYKFEEPESAIAAADRFIKLYPRHPHVDYAYYLKGLINAERNMSFLDRLLPLERSQRDPNTAVQAFQDFSQLIAHFPTSKYAQDARERMLYLRNTLAEHELQVAQFYIKRGAYVAAINRAKTVIESYQRTPAVPEALALLATLYKAVGLTDLSDSTLRVLKLNYPDHPSIARIEALAVKEQ